MMYIHLPANISAKQPLGNYFKMIGETYTTNCQAYPALFFFNQTKVTVTSHNEIHALMRTS